MRRCSRVALFALIVAWMLPTVALAQSAAIERGPRLEPGRCPFRLASGQVEGRTVDCGVVTVPERHAAPFGPTIRLAVARFRSMKGDAPRDAVIFLEGGPGGAALSSSFVRSFTTLFTPTRDFIAYDQRGTGFSDPNLDCPEVRDQGRRDDTRHTTLDEQQADELAAELACRDRLTSQGIDPAAYSSAESAADIDDIRAALGYAQLDLLGISYGTRLGLTVMRDFPGSVRSAVLDSVSAPQASAYEEYPVSVDRAINLLFTTCAADARCNDAFPDVHGAFSRAYRQLNAAPMIVHITDPDGGQSYDIVFDGGGLVELVYDLLYYRSGLARIPAMIAQINDRSQKLLQPLLEANYFNPSSIGMGISVRCNEYIPFSDRDRAIAATEPLLPEVRETVGVGNLEPFTLCPLWPTRPPDPRDHQSVTGDIPTLVLASANDPVTPPKFGQWTAGALAKSIYIETPGIGHSVIGNGGTCAASIVRTFVEDPSSRPDTVCTTTLGIPFVVSK